MASLYLKGLRMAAVEGYSFSVASVVEDVLQQHENRSRDLDFDARRAEEAGNSRVFPASFCNFDKIHPLLSCLF